MSSRNWRLPPGVEELLPPVAWSLEQVRRKILDVFRTWGYEYIDPPVVEYLDALLVGAGADLDLQTLKVVDQRSGQLMGVRADITAQAVRVDAHSRPVEGVHRLCYAGKVVFANPVSPLDQRVPLKAGAELFGADTLASDAEVIALMLDVLRAVGIENPILVLGHMGIYQALAAELDLPAVDSAELFAAVQSKAESDIARIVGDTPVTAELVALPSLMGDRAVLAEARRVLARAPDAALRAVDALDELAALIQAEAQAVTVRFDLAELVGYGYHNGPVFSAYHADLGRALARGGRYDGVGEAFGRSRPATGFDVIVNELVTVDDPSGAIWVGWERSPAPGRASAIRSLRTGGETVLSALGPADECPPRCDRVLVFRDGGWVVDPVA